MSKSFNNLNSNYLFRYDFINKYNIKSIEKTPTIKKIVLELPVESVVLASETKNNNVSDITNVYSYFILFLLTGHVPFINFNKSKTTSYIEKNYFSLKILISNKKDVHSFIQDYIKQFLKKNIDTLFCNEIVTNKYIVLSMKMSAIHFPELDNIINKYIKTINLKELEFKVNFVFQIPFSLKKNSKKTIKNLILFV